MKSIWHRQFLVMMTVILLSFVLLGSAFALLSYRQTINDRRSSLERDAGYISEFTKEAVDRGVSVGSLAFQSYISNIGRITDTVVIIAETDGTIISASDAAMIGQKISSQAREQLLSDNTYSGIDTLGIIEENSYVFGTTVTMTTGYTPGRAELLVYTGVPTGDLISLWRPLVVLFIFTTLIVICIAFIISSLTAIHQSRPLEEMVQATRKFAHGEFDVRVDNRGRRDEIGQLADSFNAMAESLAASEDRRSEFVANISHELKTPMTTIAGYADGILDGTIPPERQKEALETISSETRRLSRLVRRMLDLSRLQMTETVVAQKPFDITEVMARVLVNLEAKITAKNLQVDVQFPEEPLMVWGEVDDITQVGYNLLENATKFAQEGGVLRIIVLPGKGNKATVSIGDEGETIPPDELSMIFDRFHKTDHSRSVDRDGVGLGLYIAKTILDNHEENISVTSENGWTEFSFTLTKV